jgi:prepilin-type N-terminal cleavage/methylation domain-containing protein
MPSYPRRLEIINVYRRRLKQAGFTLIELVMVMVIMGIISVVVGKILFQTYQAFATSQNITNADWQGFVALERMSDEIKAIRSSSDISTIAASNLVFTDINGNSVQFQLSGTNLLRNSQTLASGIQSLTFGYQSSSGSTTATASLVRYITISLTVTQGTITTTFSTMVGTRGMK